MKNWGEYGREHKKTDLYVALVLGKTGRARKYGGSQHKQYLSYKSRS